MLNISNYYEQLVIDRLWKIKEDSEVTLGQAFLEDVACLALNQLPISYVRNSIDKSVYLNEQHCYEMTQEVDRVILLAIQKVRSNPRDESER